VNESQKQERRGAKVYGGTTNSGSGNGGRKNDVRTPSLSIEFKTTSKRSFRLTILQLLLAQRNALIEGRDALFGIDFRDGVKIHRFVVQTEDQYLEMRDQWKYHCAGLSCPCNDRNDDDDVWP